MSEFRRCYRIVHGLALMLGLLASAAGRLAGDEAAPTGESVQQGIADFHDQLNAGLRARRPLEFEFIAVVVNHVQQGRLTQEMVMGTFQWARKRDELRPFPHFQFALKRRAAEVGVNL